MVRRLRVLSALLPLAACNPGAFDGLLARDEEPVKDAGSTDAASPLDARVDVDARMSEPDARVEPRDGAVDATALDATLDAVVDATVDAGMDAGPACFAAGSSLISYFPMDDSPADAVALEDGGATVLGVGVQFGPGRVGSALVAGEVGAGQTRLDAPGALTISAWVRLESAPAVQNAAFLWKGDNTGEDLSAGFWLVIAGPSFRTENAKYLTGTAAQGHLGFAITNGSEEQFVLTDVPFPLLRYAHVTATFDGARMRLYVDGAIVRDEAQLVAPRSTTTALRMASDLGGTVAALPGQLDEVVFLDRALTPSEVSALYQHDGVVCTK